MHTLHVDTFLHRPHYGIYMYTLHTHTHTKLFIILSAVIASALRPHTLTSAATSAHPRTCCRHQSGDLSSRKSAYITCNASPFFSQCCRNIMKSNLRSPTLNPSSSPSSSSHLHLPPPPPHLSKGVRDEMEGLILFRPSQPWE